MVPGIMGSNLAYGAFRVWPRLFPKNAKIYKEYLPIGKMKISPAGLIEQSYGTMFKHLSDNKENKVIEFAYDWRMNNLETVEQFDLFMQQYTEGYEKVNIVAHSMGGIISKLLLNKFADRDYISKIENLITLGTPWHGSLDSYKTIVYGKSIPESFPNSIVLTKESAKLIAKGFPSVYQLFPDEKYKDRLRSEYDVCILSKNDEEIDHLGLFEQEEIKKHIETFGFEYAALIDQYKADINLATDKTAHITHHEIIGFAHTTLTSMKKNKRKEVMGEFRNGDGTVPMFSAKSEFATKRYFVKGAEHQKLVKNKHALDVVDNILRGNPIVETEKVFLNEDTVKKIGFKSKVVKIACPVEVSILKDGKSIYGYGDSLNYDDIQEAVDANINIVSLGDTVYLIFDDEEEFLEDEQIVIEAYDEGPTSISIEEFSEGAKTKSVTFKTFDINPSLVAKLDLNREVKETKLKIIKGEEVQATETPVEIKDEKIQLPRTSFSISSDHEFVTEQIRIHSGVLKITVDELHKGTYDINETYIRIDEEVVIPLDANLDYNLIELSEGLHQLKIFSVDVLGNEEISNDFSIYYLEDFKPKIHFEILPHQYKIDVKENEHIAELKGKYELPDSVVRFDVNDEENVFPVDKSVTVITQNPKVRTFNCIYETFLGNTEEQLTLDEFSVLALFEGIGDSQTLNEILHSINIINPTEIKLTKIEGNGTYRKITDKNLTNSKKIYVAFENKTLELIKRSEYIVSFHNLNEDIKIGQEHVYNFSFKVFDQESDEIRTLQPEAFLKIAINGENFISNEGDINIDFNQELDVYEGSFRVAVIEEVLRDFWDTTPIHSSELVIYKTGATSNVLRTKELKVRRE